MTEKQALQSVCEAVERLQRALDEKRSTQQKILDALLLSRGYDTTCWVDVTLIDHGLADISSCNPHATSE